MLLLLVRVAPQLVFTCNFDVIVTFDSRFPIESWVYMSMIFEGLLIIILMYIFNFDIMVHLVGSVKSAFGRRNMSKNGPEFFLIGRNGRRKPIQPAKKVHFVSQPSVIFEKTQPLHLYFSQF